MPRQAVASSANLRFGRALGSVALLALAGAVLSAGEPASDTAAPTPAPGGKYDPTEQYEVQQREGWRVLVNRHLPEREPALYAQTLRVLDHHLFAIVRHVPAEAVSKLRQITIWVELDEPHHPCMAYHPDAGWLREHDMNPEKAGCIEIADARNFVTWTLDQPAMVLHELAHGYHYRFLPGSYENPEIAAAYRRAKEARLYDSVLRRGFQKARAYAMNNPMEYFAENTEALFGTNDFYPFVIAELHEHDPEMYALLVKLWGVP